MPHPPKKNARNNEHATDETIPFAYRMQTTRGMSSTKNNGAPTISLSAPAKELSSPPVGTVMPDKVFQL